MGEAKRRRALAGPVGEVVAASGLTFAEIERLAAEDPDDRLCREAHGIPYEADWQDPAEACRNGCGLPYEEIVCGKIRQCRGPQ